MIVANFTAKTKKKPIFFTLSPTKQKNAVATKFATAQ